ncbi:MAG: hypothetical protein OHK0023_22400 [Anaerolineae bacterium]
MFPVKPLIASDVELHGSEGDAAAICLPISRFDLYHCGAAWQHFNFCYVWRHNTPVRAVYLFQTACYALGDVLKVRAARLGAPIHYLRLEQVRMVHPARLTEDELALLGSSEQASSFVKRARRGDGDPHWWLCGKLVSKPRYHREVECDLAPLVRLSYHTPHHAGQMEHSYSWEA